MIDGIIKGDGTSRLARSVANIKELYPTYDSFIAALAAGTLPLDILINAEGWSQLPDFLNKANLFSDYNSAAFGFDPMMSEVDLSKNSPGDLIKLPYDGKLVDFIVCNKNYEPDLNGPDRVLLLQKDWVDVILWDDSSQDFATSNVCNWFNTDYLGKLGEEVKSQIGETTFRYTQGYGKPVTTLTKAVFAPSLTEYGFSDSKANVEGTKFDGVENYRYCVKDGLRGYATTRTPTVSQTGYVYLIEPSATAANWRTFAFPGHTARPCFTLPVTFKGSWVALNDGTLVDSIANLPNPTPDLAFKSLSKNHIQGQVITYLGTGVGGENNPTEVDFGDFYPDVCFCFGPNIYDAKSLLFFTKDEKNSVYGSLRGDPTLCFETRQIYTNVSDFGYVKIRHLFMDGKVLFWSTETTNPELQQNNKQGAVYAVIGLKFRF